MAKKLESFFGRSFSQVAPMKKVSHINIVTLTPGYADIKAERATFKNVDSTWRVITHTFSAEQVLRVVSHNFCCMTSAQLASFPITFAARQVLSPRRFL